MFARVSTYAIDGDRMDEAVQSFDEALGRIRDLEGFQEAWVLVSPDDSRAVTVTFWESRESMESSRVAASRARSDAARAADGEVESSCEYRLALKV